MILGDFKPRYILPRLFIAIRPACRVLKRLYILASLTILKRIYVYTPPPTDGPRFTDNGLNSISFRNTYGYLIKKLRISGDIG